MLSFFFFMFKDFVFDGQVVMMFLGLMVSMLDVLLIVFVVLIFDIDGGLWYFLELLVLGIVNLFSFAGEGLLVVVLLEFLVFDFFVLYAIEFKGWWFDYVWLKLGC